MNKTFFFSTSSMKMKLNLKFSIKQLNQFRTQSTERMSVYSHMAKLAQGRHLLCSALLKRKKYHQKNGRYTKASLQEVSNSSLSKFQTIIPSNGNIRSSCPFKKYIQILSSTSQPNLKPPWTTSKKFKFPAFNQFRYTLEMPFLLEKLHKLT